MRADLRLLIVLALSLSACAPEETASAPATAPIAVPAPSATARPTPSLAARSTDTPLPTPAATAVPKPLAAAGLIAFSSMSEFTGETRIILSRPDGSNQTPLTEAVDDYANAAWSPDGMRLAVRKTFDGITVIHLAAEAGGLRAARFEALTSTFDDAPAWSPDGAQLAFASGGNGFDVYRMNADGSGLTNLTRQAGDDKDPTWSPDGAWIAFSSARVDGQDDIYVMRADGSQVTRLTNHPAFDSRPAWSPDGRRLAFTSRRDGDTEIYVMDPDGSNLVNLTHSPGDDYDPAWSPDGAQIAFTSERDGNQEIYVMNADGSGVLRLTNSPTSDRWPAWQPLPPGASLPPLPDCQPQAEFLADVTVPDGTQFAGPRSFTKTWRVRNSGDCTWAPTNYRLRFQDGEPLGGPDGGLPMPGAIAPGQEVDLSLSLQAPEAPGPYTSRWQIVDGAGQPVPGPSGRPLTLSVVLEVLDPDRLALPASLYFLSDQGDGQQVWRLANDGRTLTQLTHEISPVTSLDVSALDGTLAYASNGQLILADRGGGSRRVLIEAQAGSPVWSPDGTQLAYAFDGVKLFNLTTGEGRVVISDSGQGTSKVRRYAPRSWSPDGTKLVTRVGYYECNGFAVLALDGTVLAGFGFGGIGTAAWTPDSASLYVAEPAMGGFCDNESGLWRVDVATGAVVELIPEASGGQLAFPGWPIVAANGGLRFFYGERRGSGDETVWEAPLRMFASGSDGVTGRAPLRDDPYVFYDQYSFGEVLWAPDASLAVITSVTDHPPLKSAWVLKADGSPPIFLGFPGVDLSWGP